MADLSGITAVRPTATTVYSRVTYGATIAAGDSVYQDAGDSEYKLADNDDTSATAAAKGVAMTPGVDGGYGFVATAGEVILVGATVAVGEQYAVSSNAGKICPDADLGAADYVTQLGVGITTSSIYLNVLATGVQHA